MKRIRFAAITVILMMTLSAWAQLSTATLFGSVTDNTGAVIPNATITLTQVDTNFTRTLKSDEQGQYRGEFLPIGSYTAKVEASGFKVLEHKGIALTATQNANLNFTLNIGTESTVVEVTSEVPIVNLGNSTLSRTVDSIEVDNLPLVGRNAYRLLDLTPGVQSNTFGATLGGPIIKDKTFLFGSYGGLRQVNPVNFNTVVPDALQRVGNFSENLPTTTPATGLGACATALNAADKANTSFGGKFFVCDPVTHQPIAGNRGDLNANYKALLDPVAAAVLSQNVPLPTPGRTDN